MERLTKCHEEVPTFHQNLMYKARAGEGGRRGHNIHSRLRAFRGTMMKVISNDRRYNNDGDIKLY